MSSILILFTIIKKNFIFIFRCNFENLAYDSLFMSIVRHFAIILKSPINITKSICGLFLMFTGCFNVGTYSMYAMKKKDFKTSAKMFANNILFKNPLKCMTFFMVSIFNMKFLLNISYRIYLHFIILYR